MSPSIDTMTDIEIKKIELSISIFSFPQLRKRISPREAWTNVIFCADTFLLGVLRQLKHGLKQALSLS